MIARRESNVRARISSAVAAGAAALILASSLASIAGQRPSIAESHSGLGSEIGSGGHECWEAASTTSLALSRIDSKKARQEGSTELGFSAQRACKSSTKPALPPYRNEVSART